MCDTCQSKYDQYSALKGQISSALEKLDACDTTVTTMKNIFVDVVINGFTIDNDFSGDMLRYFGLICDNLSTMISQCNAEMNRIKSNCPGPDHYNSKLKAEKRRFS